MSAPCAGGGSCRERYAEREAGGESLVGEPQAAGPPLPQESARTSVTPSIPRGVAALPHWLVEGAAGRRREWAATGSSRGGDAAVPLSSDVVRHWADADGVVARWR